MLVRLVCCLALGLATAGCAPQCHQERYCRVFDVLGECWSPACEVLGAKLEAREWADDSHAASRVIPILSGGVGTLPVEVSIHPGAYAEDASGMDRLIVEARPNDPASYQKLSALTVAATSSDVACQRRLTGVSTDWICDVQAVGDGKVKVDLPPPYSWFELRVYFMESSCTGIRQACPG